MAIIVAPAVGNRSYTSEAFSEGITTTYQNTSTTTLSNPNPLTVYALGGASSNSQTVGFPT